MKNLFLIFVLALMPLACGDESGELVQKQEGQEPDDPIVEQPAQPPADIDDTGLQPPQTNTNVKKEGNTITAAGLQFEIDPAWNMVPPESSMRAAQFQLPAQGDDSEPAEMAVYSNIGGGADANIQRWINQFQQPDGTPSSEVAKVDNKKIGNLMVTTLDVTGTYVLSPMMGGGGTKPNYRLLGAVVIGGQGPWYFKLTGSQETVDHWKPAFNKMIDSLKSAS